MRLCCALLLATTALAIDPKVVDPERDDSHLHRCNHSDSSPQCGPDRECAYDPVYSQDKSVNCTCQLDADGNAHCMMCLHSKLSAFQGTDGLGTSGEGTMLNQGAHGLANQSGMVDTSKDINKMAHVS